MTVVLVVPHGSPAADRVSDAVLADQLTRFLHAQVRPVWSESGREFSTEGASVAQVEVAAAFWLPTVAWRVEDRPAGPAGAPGQPARARTAAPVVVPAPVHQRGLGQVQTLCRGGDAGPFGWVRLTSQVSCARCNWEQMAVLARLFDEAMQSVVEKFQQVASALRDFVESDLVSAVHVAWSEEVRGA